MGRTKKKNNRIETNLLIENAPLCKECPAKIYQKEKNPTQKIFYS